jgi:tryptophanyl-tRNA synthetase
MTTLNSAFTPRVFSGVQPTGNLHLGNYLGAIRNFVDLQKTHQCLYCVVDLHAITVWQNPEELRQNTRETAAVFLAAGIDPKTHVIFNQSQVGAHAELAWILQCVARIGWLNRMTQFKEKAGKDRENASVGLFAYPILMAADILAYHATHVPVGEDQKQHLELARDIAQKFNNDFPAASASHDGAGFFPLPEPLILGETTRVMSLRDGSVKMSKSDPSDYARINLSDDADTIAKKIRKARTDPYPLPGHEDELKNRPEADNLLRIYAALSRQPRDAVLRQFSGKPFANFKEELSALAIDSLAPITCEIARLKKNPDYIDAVLSEGAARAHALAAPIMRALRDIVGFVQSRN